MFELTEAQQKRLDAFPDDTKVVTLGKWGPIVRRADGSFREITPQGRLRRGNLVDRFGELAVRAAENHRLVARQQRTLVAVHEQLAKS